MHDDFYITGIRRGLGRRLWQEYGSVDRLKDCDVFINCKHDGFDQVKLLYEAAELGKRIINIGSNSPDESKRQPHIYQVEKFALDKANEQLFYLGVVFMMGRKLGKPFVHCLRLRNVEFSGRLWLPIGPVPSG
mgnify:CR=1 FL=1